MKRIMILFLLVFGVMTFSANFNLAVYERSDFEFSVYLENYDSDIDIRFTHVPDYISDLRYEKSDNLLLFHFSTGVSVENGAIEGVIDKKDGSSKIFVLYLQKTIKFEITSLSYENGSVNVSWNSIPGSEYYEVGKLENGSFTVISSQLYNTSFKDENIEYGRRYTYQVRAKTDDGYIYTEPKTIEIPVYSEDLIKTYPNPARDKITFSELPENGKVKIYSLSGELLKTIEIDQTTEEWNLRNDSEKEITSGIYLFVIVDSGGKPLKKGKVAVLR
ncbi:T9SS type A sorting domain-containing protein [bacterium]|nr:T9SS type A sorting domain-containing protein [bacterium]